MRQLRHFARRRARRAPPLPRWKLFLYRTGTALLLIVLMASSGWLLGRSSMVAAWAEKTTVKVVGFFSAEGFVVAEVFTEGRRRSKRNEIIRILEPYQMQSILLVDTVTIRRQLETLPWVRTASVKRAFPNELRIHLEEYAPVARFLDNGRERLLANDGTVIDVVAASAFSHLPRLSGHGVERKMAEFWGLLRAEPDLARRVVGATLIGERRWDLALDNGTKVRLPRDEPEKAMRELAQFEREEMILDRAVSAIDLRSPGWVVIEPLEDVRSLTMPERAA
ncbi:MAG: cell division protein FtsQ/DivIB [Pseudomonadota bacterium]